MYLERAHPAFLTTLVVLVFKASHSKLAFQKCVYLLGVRASWKSTTLLVAMNQTIRNNAIIESTINVKPHNHKLGSCLPQK